jgi:UDPglucose 6-dehydrogenase
LSFKPNTDDIRFAPSIYAIERLLEDGFTITAYDAEAEDNTRAIFGDKISYVDRPYEAVEGKDCLVIFTEWNEFKQTDLKRVKELLKNPCVIDGRNIYDPSSMEKLGFTYISIGR